MTLRSLTVAVAMLSAISLTPAAHADGCSCSAPDGSCSASVSCEGGCYSYCDTGACDAQCTSAGPNNGPRHQTLTYGPQELRSGPAFAGPSVGEVLSRTVTVQMDGALPEIVAPYFAADLGAQFAFIATDQDNLVNLDVKGFPVDQLVRVLGKRGGAALASGGQLYLSATGIGSEQFSELLSNVLGMPVEFAPARSGQPVNLEVKGAGVEDFLRFLAKRGTVSFPGL